MQTNIPQGTRCLKPTATAKKLDRGISWLWARLKNDPAFPRPVYLSPKAPVFLEHEIDAWLENQVKQSRQAV